MALSFLVSACSVPQHHAVDDRVVTAKCAIPNSDTRVYRRVDTCPDFGGPPRAGEWRLHFATDWQPQLPSWWNDPPRAYSLRSCYSRAGSQTARVAKLSIEDVKTWWDFENGDRMWIYGRAVTDEGEVPFVYEKEYRAKPVIENELRRMFTSCAG